MAKHAVKWNNGASLRLAKIMGHEYVEDTYKVLQTALNFFLRIKDEDQKRTIRVDEWEAFGRIYYAAHYTATNGQVEVDEDEALGHVMRHPADIVEVLTQAIESIGKPSEEDAKENA